MDHVDIVLRFVPCHGWLPILVADDQEILRGKFRRTAEEALAVAQQSRQFSELLAGKVPADQPQIDQFSQDGLSDGWSF